LFRLVPCLAIQLSHPQGSHRPPTLFDRGGGSGKTKKEKTNIAYAISGGYDRPQGKKKEEKKQETCQINLSCFLQYKCLSGTKNLFYIY